MQLVVSFLERFINWLGRTVATLAIFMALITLIVVILRYIFDIGSIALQESVLYMHGLLIMLGLAYALQTDSHVRVDIVYSRLKPSVQRWVNLAGHTFFLIPFALVLIFTSWDYVVASWRVRESSPEVGGIPGIYILKSLIPLAAVLLIVQALCEMVKLLIEWRQKDD